MLPAHPRCLVWPPAPESLFQMPGPALAGVLFLYWPEVGNVGLARHPLSPTPSSEERPSRPAFSGLPTHSVVLACFGTSSPAPPARHPQHGLFTLPLCTRMGAGVDMGSTVLSSCTLLCTLGCVLFPPTPACPCPLLPEKQEDLCESVAKVRGASRGSHGRWATGH